MPTNFPSSLDDFENPNSNVIIASQGISGPHALIEAALINPAQIFIKFKPTVKTSTILNSNIILKTNGATPALASSDPFEEIQLAYHYNSVSRILTLTWKESILQPSTNYRIIFSNFKTVSNVLISDDFVDFETSLEVVPDPEDVPPIIPPPVQIIDYSLIPDVVVSSGVDSDSDDTILFKFVDSDPVNFDAFLPEDYNNGVVILKFSLSPNIDFLTEDYIIAQSKIIQRRTSRWTNVPIQITADPDKPWVYIAFPSNDATPLYNTADAVYFEKNYKYRIRLASGIGV